MQSAKPSQRLCTGIQLLEEEHVKAPWEQLSLAEGKNNNNHLKMDFFYNISQFILSFISLALLFLKYLKIYSVLEYSRLW